MRNPGCNRRTRLILDLCPPVASWMCCPRSRILERSSRGRQSWLGSCQELMLVRRFISQKATTTVQHLLFGCGPAFLTGAPPLFHRLRCPPQVILAPEYADGVGFTVAEFGTDNACLNPRTATRNHERIVSRQLSQPAIPLVEQGLRGAPPIDAPNLNPRLPSDAWRCDFNHDRPRIALVCPDNPTLRRIGVYPEPRRRSLRLLNLSSLRKRCGNYRQQDHHGQLAPGW